MNSKQFLTNQRKIRVRKRLMSHANRPRLSVFRSNQHIYAQLIDDQAGVTITSASDLSLKVGKTKLTKIEKATKVGEQLAKQILETKTKKVAFDRGSYKFHGRIKALAQAARSAGLEF